MPYMTTWDESHAERKSVSMGWGWMCTWVRQMVQWLTARLWSQTVQIQIPVSFFPTCAAMGKILVSEPQFLHL